MSEPVSQALRDALALRRAPRGPRPGPEERLPSGILQLLRIAAGEEESLASAQLATAEPPETIREASTFYIQQVLFAPVSSSFRVMGVDADESDERIREHYRWLARWLHPDRNADAWEVVFAERVNQAWQDLRTPERRERYRLQQRELRAELAGHAAAAAPAPARVALHAYAEAPVSKRLDLRWLPKAIFGSLAICAVAGVALYYAVQLAEQRRAPAVAVAAELTEVRPSRTAEAEPPPFEPTRFDAAARASALGTDAIAEQPVVPEPTVPSPSLTQEPTATLAPSASAPQPRAETASRSLGDPRAAPATAREAPARPATLAREPQSPIKSPRAPAPAPTRAPEPVLPPPEVADANAVARAEAPKSSEGAKAAVTSRDANRLLNRFSNAYEQGDLARMRSLFTADARGPRGGIKVIIADYDRVFETSRDRSLAVQDVSWFLSGETLTIVASFQASLTSGRSGKQRRTRGDIRMDLRRQGGEWQIYRLQHDERPG